MNGRCNPYRLTVAALAVAWTACLTVATGPVVAAETVPVLNAGFEQADPGREGMPLGWGTYPGSPEGERMAFIWDDQVAHSGARSVSMVVSERGTSWLPSSISDYATSLDGEDLKGLRPSAVVGRRYTLSAWVKGEGSGATGAVLVLRWTNEDGWVPTYTREYFQLEGDEWQRLSISAVAPEGTKNICPILQVSGSPKTGRIWFDDVTITDVTGLRCEVVASPELCALPDEWQVVLEISNESDVAAGVSLTAAPRGPQVDAESADLQVPPGESLRRDLRYRAAGAHTLWYRVTDPDDEALYLQGNVVVPSALEAEYVFPHYRATLFGGDAKAPVKLRGLVHVSDTLRETCSLRAAIVQGETTLADETVAGPEAEQAITLQPRDLSAGDYSIELSLSARGAELGTTTLPLHVRPETQPLAAIGPDNELILEGKPTFPIGFYSTLSEDYKQFKQDGFNCVLSYTSDVNACENMAKMAEAAGLKVIVSALRPSLAGRDEARLAEAVDRLRDRPGIMGYYLWDEPSLSHPDATPEGMRWLYEQAAEKDSSRITCTVFCRPSELKLYADTMDVVLVDPYPTHYGREADLTMVSDWVDSARKAVGDQKPVWLVPQAFDHLLGPGTYRMPTIEEQRCMSYLGLTHGAKGIIWFVYTGFCINSEELAKQKGEQFAWVYRGTIPRCFPLRYEGIKQIVAEVNELSPVLLAPDVDQSQEIAAGSDEVHSLLKSHEGLDYLFTVNAKDRPVQFECKLPGASAAAEVLWEDREVTLEGEVLKDSFKPYEVHVYRLTRPE